MDLPKWHQELERFRSFKTTFIVEGNIHDLHSYPNTSSNELRWEMIKLDQYLSNFLISKGYETIVFYNHIDGFYNTFRPNDLQQFLELAGEKRNGEPYYQSTLDHGVEMVRKVLSDNRNSTAVILNLASRYVISPENLSEEENQFYSKLFLTTLNITQKLVEGQLLNNLLFIVPNKVNDVPAWLFLDNPYVKNLHVAKPDKETRRRFIDTQRFYGKDELSEEELSLYKEKFIDLTDGFKNIELNGLKRLCTQERIPLSRIHDGVTLFKYGIKENKWSQISDEKLENGESIIRKRIKGQHAAVTQALNIIKRAVMGISGLQHSGIGKPKGILFFAGPTGTGKTELAKTLSELLFGDENYCIRFDMSEYQQSHSDQKLLGAPPGYVGYEAGGQLTNAIKENPFSILLFDEIEKAHPSILDKFLQILEDGRMTDGQGETVYFSESIIIFTSNLGIYKKDSYGNRIPNVSMEMEYKEIEGKVTEAIQDYFTLELGRPEILNRIGNNFVVFDYIREEVAIQIFNGQMDRIKDSLLKNKDIELQVSQAVHEFIFSRALGNLHNGGRGIGNIVEKYFINPLSSFLFDAKVREQATMMIEEVKEVENIITLEGSVSHHS